MEGSVFNVIAAVVVVVAVGLFLRALLRGGRMLDKLAGRRDADGRGAP